MKPGCRGPGARRGLLVGLGLLGALGAGPAYGQ